MLKNATPRTAKEMKGMYIGRYYDFIIVYKRYGAEYGTLEERQRCEAMWRVWGRIWASEEKTPLSIMW